MSRNSEIQRAGLEMRVGALAADGKTAPRIAAIISEEAGKPFSKYMVQRHLQKNLLTATVQPDEYRDLRMLAAAISGVPDTRSTNTSSYYGQYQLDTTNPFTEYYGIARGIKNGQVLRGFKNLALKITNGAKIVGDSKDAEKIEELSNALNFSSTLQDVVRSTCEMGTCVVGMKSTDGEFIPPQLIPMRYVTLLTDNETPGTIGNALVHGKVTQTIFDEDGDAEIKYEPGDTALFRIWAGGHECADIMGRSTDGIYGESMTGGVEVPLKSMINSAYYYDAFIERYGLGRLHINLKLLADMIKDKTITPAAAQASQDADTAAFQKLQPNEDILSAGREVSMIESKTGFDIVPFLQWREAQVNHALLQSDVGAGEVGSSWTSAGTAVSAQDYDTYKSLRETLFEIFLTSIITPRLPEFKLDPASISITATPYLRVDVPYTVLTDWADRGIIGESELRIRGGFPPQKPDDM